MTLPAFELHRVSSVAEASDLLGRYGDETADDLRIRLAGLTEPPSSWPALLGSSLRILRSRLALGDQDLQEARHAALVTHGGKAQRISLCRHGGLVLLADFLALVVEPLRGMARESIDLESVALGTFIPGTTISDRITAAYDIQLFHGATL